MQTMLVSPYARYAMLMLALAYLGFNRGYFKICTARAY